MNRSNHLNKYKKSSNSLHKSRQKQSQILNPFKKVRLNNLQKHHKRLVNQLKRKQRVMQNKNNHHLLRQLLSLSQQKLLVVQTYEESPTKDTTIRNNRHETTKLRVKKSQSEKTMHTVTTHKICN